MSTAEFITLLVACATAVTAVAAGMSGFASWRQVKTLTKDLEYRVLLDTVQSNRHVIEIGLRDPNLLSVIQKEDTLDGEAKTRYAQIYINQAMLFWHQARLGITPASDLQSLKSDARSVLNSPAVQSRWSANKHSYPPDFITFMDAQ